MLTEKLINKCLNQTVVFLESSFLNFKYIDEDGRSNSIWGFPQYRSKKRITEYGGTSSGIAALYTIGRVNVSVREKADDAIDWLISKQQDGAWNSSDVLCCEVTSGVLIELVELEILPDKVISEACDFILSCYDESGYFKSMLSSEDSPHIYTTYMAVRALLVSGKLTQVIKQAVINWVKAAKASDELWGSEPNCISGTVANTAMALLTLLYCDYGVDKIKAEFKTQIRFLKESTKGCGKMYENEESNIECGKDSYGIKYQTLHTKHYVGPLLSLFFMELKEDRYAIATITSVLNSQCAGGWGPANDRLTMWATQQAVYTISRFKNNILPNQNMIKRITYTIPYSYIKLIISIIFMGITIWFILMPELRNGMIVSGFFAILPWLWERCYE